MATTTPRLMTAEEFYAFVHRPENADRFFELDEGAVIELPPPRKPHGFVCVTFGVLRWNYCRQRGRGYVCSNDTGVILARDPDTVRGPDVMPFEDEQSYDEMLAEAEAGYPETPPVLAVEILSPSDRLGKVVRKVTQYLNSGVSLVWVVDPEAKDVTAYRAGHDPLVIDAGGELAGGDVLPGLTVR
ncbi:MAG TPA: Uma2 family endonuclease, partial [Planctomycetaceae bacterium]